VFERNKKNEAGKEATQVSVTRLRAATDSNHTLE
jgi:hypothetical protein